MHTRTFRLGLLALSVLASLVLGLLALGGPRPVAANALTTGPAAVSAVTGFGFTYQGTLNAYNAPANGAYDFRFDLYGLGGNSLLTSPVPVTNVLVSNGRFTVVLDFAPYAGGNIFNGDARYLEISVSPAGANTFTILAPRQQLTAAPYALGLRPGVVISGSGSYATGFLARNSNAGGVALAGESAAPDGVAVFGSSATGWAMRADGVTKQTLGFSGWLKAALVFNGHTAAISRCFNSQVASAAVAQAVPCGFTVTRETTGTYTVDLGFTQNGFVSVVPEQWGGGSAVQSPQGSPITPAFVTMGIAPSPTAVRFSMFDLSGVLTDTANFHITVH
jgi:hypothetical protein